MRKINARKLAQTLAVLQREPVTALALSTQIGIHLITAQAWLRELKRSKTIHVCRWLPDSLGRDAIPVYALGEREDEPRRKTERAEINRRYLEKKRAATISA